MPLPLSERNSLDGKNRAETVKKIHEQARKHIEAKTKQYEKQANKGRRKLTFKEGDSVWIHLRKDRFPAERKSKLMPQIDGPFKVIRKINDNAYEIDLQGKYAISSSFNITDLLPYVADETDLRANPFEEGGDDMSIPRPDAKEENDPDADKGNGPHAAAGTFVELSGPITRARARRLREAIGVLLRSSSQEEEVPKTTLSVIQVSA